MHPSDTCHDRLFSRHPYLEVLALCAGLQSPELFGREKFTNVTLIALIRAECLLWPSGGLQVSRKTHHAVSTACLINTKQRVCWVPV
jgi:hypothetical protein